MSKQYKIDFTPVNIQNVEMMKLMVNKTFPLTYSDNLYITIAKDYQKYTILGTPVSSSFVE